MKGPKRITQTRRHGGSRVMEQTKPAPAGAKAGKGNKGNKGNKAATVK